MNGPVKYKPLELFVVISECLVIVTSQECVSPQYLELGKSGAVICSFGEGFYGVYWYNSTDYQQDFPIVYLSRSVKGGTGYATGEFDIFLNGSLLIHNVSLEHDHVFTVTFLQSQRDSQVRIDVLVVVIVVPKTPAPIILSCGGVSSVENCLIEVNKTMTLVCSVKDSRPAVDLKWTRRTSDGDAEISFKSETFSEGICSTSYITSEVSFSDSFYLTLFSCQANSPAGLLERAESFILIQNANLNLAGVHQIRKVLPRFSKLVLVCTERQGHSFIWKRVIPSRHISENILYAVEDEITTLNDEFSLEGTNSLILPRIDINDEGMYACISTDGSVENVELYSVSVMVQPVPSYPVVDGCSSDRNCAIEAMRDGVLTCSVKGIRPEIQLEWGAFREADEDVIVFANHRSHVREKDNLFDISLTVNYTVKKVSEEKVTVKCYGLGSNAHYFQLITTVDLFLKESTIASKNGATFQHWWWIVPLTIVFIAIVIVTAIMLRQRKEKQFATKQSVDTDEAMAMIDLQSSEDPKLSVKRGPFIQELQQRYEDLYNGVPLVPYRADELHCVDSVYKNPVIDHLVSKEKGHENWEKVDSYKKLFLYNAKKSTRRILHGEPGYGKSIICLKVAYDWCNSDLKDIEILVLLHLKQLGGVNSIYTAIKRYILPKDTRLSEEDIADILRDCKSVLVIFDGFDEYPDQDASIVTDINTIISRRMFQQFTIVITTRSSFTPTKYPPQTEIYRLTGFDDETRKTYIREMTNDTETATEVQTYLKEHLILQDLSQVPFLLACFVTMIQEGDNIKTAKSVTEVFRTIVSCFHSHMRNKRMFEDIHKYDTFGKKHDNLDEITFVSLGKHKKRIVWPKDEVIKKVGTDFYKQYTQIGILVEEEGVDVVENPDSDRKDVVHKKEVSFVHKLFCEWYAAHHLSRLSSCPDAKIQELVTHLDPSTLQYVYRFACGLSIDSAKRLIEYLPKLKGGEKCATLCIQEQLGAIDSFTDTISLICTHGIIISKHDSMLLQRSLIALLKTASKKNITIKSLCIYNSLKSVDTSGITTCSGEKVNVDFPIERLKINVTDRPLHENEALQLLKFSVKCRQLNYIKFGNCVPPEDIGRLGKGLLEDLRRKKLTVKWRLDFGAEFHSLNLETGKWEKEGRPTPLTPEEYESLRKQHEKDIERETEEKCKNDVEKGREILRLSGVKK